MCIDFLCFALLEWVGCLLIFLDCGVVDGFGLFDGCFAC